jgi:hypothetical protein
MNLACADLVAVLSKEVLVGAVDAMCINLRYDDAALGWGFAFLHRVQIALIVWAIFHMVGARFSWLVFRLMFGVGDVFGFFHPVVKAFLEKLGREFIDFLEELLSVRHLGCWLLDWDFGPFTVDSAANPVCTALALCTLFPRGGGFLLLLLNFGLYLLDPSMLGSLVGCLR